MKRTKRQNPLARAMLMGSLVHRIQDVQVSHGMSWCTVQVSGRSFLGNCNRATPAPWKKLENCQRLFDPFDPFDPQVTGKLLMSFLASKYAGVLEVWTYLSVTFLPSKHGKLTMLSHWLCVSSNYLPSKWWKLPLVSQPVSSRATSISIVIPSKYGKLIIHYQLYEVFHMWCELITYDRPQDI